MRQDSRYCWTAFDAHAKNAEDYAARASQAGIDYFCLHAIDSGGMLDPEKWPERCERCRAYYGDDHARAAIDQFTRYYNAYKALSPDGLFEAVVLPYHFQWTVEGFADDPVKFGKTLPHMGWIRGLENDPALARQCVADLKAYHAKIAEGLPRDVAVTFREAGRAEFDGVCDLWKDHPVNIWYYLGRNRGWVGLWEPQCRMLKTWKRDEPRDTLCYEGSNHTGVVPPIWVAGSAEYAWSMRQPDASDQFQTTSRFYDTEGRNVTDYQRDSLIPRILRALWHPRIAEAVAPLFANNLSFNYIADPEAAAASGDGENWDDPFVHLEAAVAILPGVAERLRALVAAIDAGEPLGAGGGDIRREYGYQWLMYLYETVHLASAKAQMDWAAYRAGMSAARGDLAQARAIADAAIERLPGLIETQGQVKARMDADAYVMRRPSKRAGASEYRLAQFPLDKQAARLRAIAADAEQAAERPEAGATRISLTEAARENRTVDYGFSTIVRFRPAAVFAAPVKGAKLSIAMKEGAETLGERTLEIGAAAGRWSALKLLDFDLGKVAKGDLRIEATLLCEGAAAKTFVFAMAPDGAVAPK
ncbi:MAG: hypothetical protein BWZ10_02220 [candidate division BRC1 bacterium ADurb.BinA364]|nr:MAG: hypothetical protein BWZ10_02220 [candidate division BRC1 bacterium ADurb.BinA364]